MARKRQLPGQVPESFPGFVQALREAAGSWESLGRRVGLSEKTARRYAAGKSPQSAREVEQLILAAGEFSLGVPPTVLSLLKRLPGRARAGQGGIVASPLPDLLPMIQALLQEHATDLTEIKARVTELERAVFRRQTGTGSKRG